MMDRLRAEAVGNDDLHLSVLRRQPSTALRGKPSAQIGRAEMGLFARRLGGNSAEWRDALKVVDAQFGVDRFTANALIQSHLAGHGVRGPRAGAFEPIERRGSRDKFLQFGLRFTKRLRIAP